MGLPSSSTAGYSCAAAARSVPDLFFMAGLAGAAAGLKTFLGPSVTSGALLPVRLCRMRPYLMPLDLGAVAAPPEGVLSSGSGAANLTAEPERFIGYPSSGLKDTQGTARRHNSTATDVQLVRHMPSGAVHSKDADVERMLVKWYQPSPKAFSLHAWLLLSCAGCCSLLRCCFLCCWIAAQ